MLLGLGLLLRLVVYGQNRSLRIDEANLALNIIERNGLEFFQSLDYKQYCPPLQQLFFKTAVNLGGINEWALKILPLLSGIAALLLLYLLAKKWLDNGPILWYLLGLIACSHLMIRYSTELKQYSTDAAVALFLLWYAGRSLYKTWVSKDYLLWAGLGMVAIWGSMPSIFILAALGVVRLWRQPSWYLVGLGAFWVFHFWVYFWLILRQDATTDYLQNFHEAYFWKGLPTSLAAWQHNFKLLINILTSVTDRTVLWLLLAAGLGYWFGQL